MKTQLEKQVFDNHCWPTDRVVAPCREACPVGTDAGGYVMAILMEDYDEAYRIIAEHNPLPGVCGRICHHPCETECVRSRIDQPIAIKALKRFATEKASKSVRAALPFTSKKTGQRAAVIGSGPSGLAAAYDLTVMGHDVTVFEKSDRPGGLLNLAIPPFILPRKVLAADLNRIEALGVEFETCSEIRGRKGVEDLFKKGYSAVLLAIGALESQGLKGVDLSSPRVETGLSFLMRMQKKPKQRIEGRVLIIGGGNVAIDAARLCVRQGAGEVNVFCLEKRDAMPAFDWERNRAEKEGVRIFDGWGLISAEEKKGLKAQFARVKKIKTSKDGSLVPVMDTDERKKINTENIIVAVGQKIDLDALKGLRISLTQQGTLDTDPHFMTPNIPGLFAAGDMVIYPGTVTGAMGIGKEAAKAIDRFLKGEGQKQPVSAGRSPARASYINEELLTLFPKRNRARMPEIKMDMARRSLKEVEKGFSNTAALKEASRCLNCAMCSHCIMDRQRICRETATRLWA